MTFIVIYIYLENIDILTKNVLITLVNDKGSYLLSMCACLCSRKQTLLESSFSLSLLRLTSAGVLE